MGKPAKNVKALGVGLRERTPDDAGPDESSGDDGAGLSPSPGCPGQRPGGGARRSRTRCRGRSGLV